MSNIIDVKDVSFGYGRELIFSKIEFLIEKGDFVAIIGSNGTGKSTLLNLLLGELSPCSGSISLFDQDIQKFNKWSKIGYIPQAGLLTKSNFPATAEEIVQANLFSQIGLLKFPKKEHRDKTQKALEAVGMSSYSKRLIGELSGGQQQRVLLARVLVNEPEVMLLDEPTNGVDAPSVRSMYELLQGLNREKGLTIVMVTHDISKATKYVSRILCLEEGSLIELEKKQIENELSHKHKHP